MSRRTVKIFLVGAALAFGGLGIATATTGSAAVVPRPPIKMTAPATSTVLEPTMAPPRAPAPPAAGEAGDDPATCGSCLFPSNGPTAD